MSSPSPDARVAELAATQGGALSRSQAVARGVTDRMIEHRLRRGRWRRIHPGVYLLAGAPRSWLTEVRCVCLAAGPAAVVSHESALVLHGVPDQLVPRRPVTCTVPHGTHPRVAGAVVHQIDDLRPEDVTLHPSGLRLSVAGRAVVEVAATLGRRHLADVVDYAIVHRVVTPLQVSRALAAVARPGKPGVRKLGGILDDRGPGRAPPHSALEGAMFEVLERGGLPPPRRQAALPGRGAVGGTVDAAYDDARLIIEVDGRRWHSRVRDMARDRERDAEAARAGWLTLRLMHEHLVGDPDGVCALIRDVRATRLGQRPVPRARQ